MRNSRKGLGKGLGTGYKNLTPIDSHIHSLSAKGVKTLLTDSKKKKYTKPKYVCYKCGKPRVSGVSKCPYCGSDTITKINAKGITKGLEIKKQIIGMKVTDKKGNEGIVVGVNWKVDGYEYEVLAVNGGSFTITSNTAKFIGKANQSYINEVWQNANPFAKDTMVAYGFKPSGIYRLKYRRNDDKTIDFEDFATKKEADSWGKVRIRDDITNSYKISKI